MQTHEFDLIIENGQLALLDSDGEYQLRNTDLGIKDGKIKFIGDLKGKPAAKKIEARGLIVAPGAIDSQVHFREPGLTHKEDLESGTRAALLGGVTAIFEMPNTNPSTVTRELFAQKMQLAGQKANTHYAFFIGGCAENADELAQLEKLPHCSGIKIFMGSSTGSLLVEDDRLLEKIFRQGHRRVILHAEDEYILRERKHLAEESRNVLDHPIWRNVDSAVSATNRAIRLSTQTKRPIHILHVSSKDEAEIIAREKKVLGSQLSCEMLPQYLTLWAPECYERLGTLAQQNPPIRDKSNYDGLWKAVQAGVFDVFGSDHAPHTLQEKSKDYPSSPSGVPGVQTLLPILLNHVNAGRLSLSQLLRMLCENQRRVFGIKNKGRLQVGFDADITLIDINRRDKIENSKMATKVGWTPFDGMEITGWPVGTILKGKLCMQDGEVLIEKQGQPVDFE